MSKLFNLAVIAATAPLSALHTVIARSEHGVPMDTGIAIGAGLVAAVAAVHAIVTPSR